VVSLLDHADLQCPDGHGQLVPGVNWEIHIGQGIRETRGYLCSSCRFFVTQIAFLQNSHGTREQRRARIREIGLVAPPGTGIVEAMLSL
jgi:hypothetical protein